MSDESDLRLSLLTNATTARHSSEMIRCPIRLSRAFQLVPIRIGTRGLQGEIVALLVTGRALCFHSDIYYKI